jgi:hypothetical protein
MCPFPSKRLTIGFPPTKSHWYFAKLPNSSCTSRYARAFFTADSSFSRFRTMPSFFSSFSMRRES